MPLEQYGSIIDRLKQEEEERLMRERAAALAQAQLQANPTTTEMQGGGDPTAYFEQAKRFIQDNPPPQANTTTRLFDLIGRVGDRMSGQKPRDWTTPPDPFQKLRETVAQQMVTQGLRGQEQMKIEQEKARLRYGPEARGFESFKAKQGNPAQMDMWTAQAYAARKRIATEAKRATTEEERNRKLNELTDIDIQIKQMERTGMERGQGLQGTIMDSIEAKERRRQGLPPRTPTPPQAETSLTPLGEFPDAEAQRLLESGAKVRDIRNLPQSEQDRIVGFRPDVAGGGSTTAPGFSEPAFQQWYAERAQRFGLNPNPDDPQHKYDYRAAFRAGVEPDPTTGHWPSQFKAPDHPNRYVGGVDTITGQPAPPDDTRYRTNVQIDPAGRMSLNLLEEQTPEAIAAAKQREAAQQRLQQAPAEGDKTKVEQYMKMTSSIDRIAANWNPNQMGIIANAFMDFKRAGDQLDPKHAAVAREVALLEDLVVRINSGAAAGDAEFARLAKTLPNLWTGNANLFMQELKILKEETDFLLNLRLDMMSAPVGGMRDVVNQYRQQSQQANPPSPAAAAATQPAYPKGAPPGLTYDPRLGKWRMP